MWSNGRQGVTPLNGNKYKAKLTQSQVDEIRGIYAREKITLASLGARFGMSYGAIQAITAGRTWR